MAKKTRGRIGNPNPNQQARLTFRPTRRPSVKRALDPLTFKTLQAQTPPAGLTALDKPAITANTVTQRGRRLLGGSRQGVRRLFRKDPYNKWSADAPPPFGTGATVATFAPEAAQVDTTNPNPEFHPEQSPGAVKVVRQPQAAAGTKNRGKIFQPNRTTLFGGKRLRKV